MVTCKLYGRAANQAFMISAAICHAWKIGGDFAIPRKTTSPKIWPTYFNHLPPLQPYRTTQHYFFQSGHGYNPIPDYDDITLDGYFQSEKYWGGYKENLADIMGFEYKPENFIAIHHRRGDYLQFKDQFPVLPMDYYSAAIDYFISKGYDRFVVFSDDIKWCMKEYAQMGVAFEYSTGKDAVSDMKYMYNAAGFIIANSTFSLYPALLRTDNPLTIAPEDHRWFGPSGQDMNSPDRIPERFIKI